MRNQGSKLPLPLIVVAVVCATMAFAPEARAATPQSREVRLMVSRGIEFIESDAANDSRVGAQALVGMALVKHGTKPDHPKIVAAVEAIKKTLSAAAKPSEVKADIYSVGLSIIFLITLDPSKYHPEIEALLDCLDVRQKEHGGWGYPTKETGDTSMTQYGVLSSWEALQAGFNVAPESVEDVALWLLRTQDPSGAFGYQGKVSKNFKPVKQSGVRSSMAVAGLGSVYICADLLGLGGQAKEETDLPPAMEEVKPEEKPAARVQGTRIDPRVIRGVQARGDKWVRDNFEIAPGNYTYYYLYALERYQSFREASLGKPEKEPRWYNEGVRFLAEKQQDNGAWRSNIGETVDTAFAVLFLMRSTKKRIEKSRGLGDGTLVGGRGLPKDTSQVKVDRGKVVTKSSEGLADSLLAAIKKPGGLRDPEVMEKLAELPPEEGKALISQHAAKLRELARDDSPEARRAAVAALISSGNLDHVPTLIYALSDPAPGVVAEARNGLRRISRRFNGFGMPNKPSEAERGKAIDDWKKWYLAIRPDAQFED